MALVAQQGGTQYKKATPNYKTNYNNKNTQAGAAKYLASLKTPITPKTTNPTTSVPTNSYQSIIDAYTKRQQDSLNAAKNALLSRFNSTIGSFDAQEAELDDQYQALINQSEVDRYKSKASIREALANRGQLDSGLGRQETLNMQSKYGNQVSNIKLQRQKAKDEIANLRTQAKAEYEAEMANLLNTYNTNLASFMAQI